MAKIEHDQPNPSARASIKVWIIHTTIDIRGEAGLETLQTSGK